MRQRRFNTLSCRYVSTRWSIQRVGWTAVAWVMRNVPWRCGIDTANTVDMRVKDTASQRTGTMLQKSSWARRLMNHVVKSPSLDAFDELSAANITENMLVHPASAGDGLSWRKFVTLLWRHQRILRPILHPAGSTLPHSAYFTSHS